MPSETRLVEFEKDQCYDGRWTTPGEKPKTDPITVRTEGNSENGDIVWIAVTGKGVTTKSGAAVGTSLDELRSLFPEATIKHEVDDTLVIVKDSAGQVMFEVHDTDEDGNDQEPAVAAIFVHPTGEPNDPILHGDAFGPCYGA